MKKVSPWVYVVTMSLGKWTHISGGYGVMSMIRISCFVLLPLLLLGACDDIVSAPETAPKPASPKIVAEIGKLEPTAATAAQRARRFVAASTGTIRPDQAGVTEGATFTVKVWFTTDTIPDSGSCTIGLEDSATGTMDDAIATVQSGRQFALTPDITAPVSDTNDPNVDRTITATLSGCSLRIDGHPEPFSFGSRRSAIHVYEPSPGVEVDTDMNASAVALDHRSISVSWGRKGGDRYFPPNGLYSVRRGGVTLPESTWACSATGGPYGRAGTLPCYSWSAIAANLNPNTLYCFTIGDLTGQLATVTVCVRTLNDPGYEAESPPPGGDPVDVTISSGNPCDRFKQAVRRDGSAQYVGQCHGGSYSYYTIDTLSQGQSAITISANQVGVTICGHNGTSTTMIGSRTNWCDDGEWVYVGLL